MGEATGATQREEREGKNCLTELYCPITSKAKGLSFEVPLFAGMQTKGVVLADQIKTLDWKARKGKFVESVSQDLIEEVQAKLETLIL